MKKEWENFYKGLMEGSGKKRNYKGFVNYCELLEKYNGKPLSDYINSESNVTFEVFGITITMTCNHVKRFIDQLTNILESLNNNQDEFISFNKTDNDKYLQVTFKQLDGGINTVSTIGYSHYVRGRINFYNELNKNNHIALSPYLGSDKKVLINYKCGHQPTENTPNKYVDQGRRCPICAGRTIIPYVNDFYTIHNDLVKYLVNPEEAIGVPTYSTGKHHLRCPICGVGEKWTTFDNLIKSGFTCPYCDNKTSYFNRFMNILLTELKEDFVPEKEFDWCRFLSYDKTRYKKGIYDFVIENKKLIIEMDGGFHTMDNTMNGQSKKEIEYIDRMKDEKAMQNGYKVVRIDCQYNQISKRFDMLINNIYKSEFINYYDISKIDLEKINEQALENNIKKICDYWNEKYSIAEIHEITKLCKTTISDYLHIGNTIGWCVYYKNMGKSRTISFKIKALQNGKLIGVYGSRKEAVTQLKEKYNIIFDRDLISKTINGERKTYKGINFIKINNDEYRKLLNEKIYELDLSLIPKNIHLN